MILSLIVAMTPITHVIGKNNGIPWYLSGDLSYFSKQTHNKPVIMGRKTYESIGKPLKNRLNIVVSKTAKNIHGCIVVDTIDNAINHAKNAQAQEAFFIGGSRIYAEALKIVDKMYITYVMGAYDGDACFPNIDGEKWNLLSVDNHYSDDKNECDYSFLIFDRKR